MPAGYSSPGHSGSERGQDSNFAPHRLRGSLIGAPKQTYCNRVQPPPTKIDNGPSGPTRGLTKRK